ncbi:WXG100 family type VII secretion target [Cellulomonas endophytica]|uniref:WXG100 family type VII secretion target n=1 Tax=Cellulomonas endophytica TaxID=2494735 RepID=UPI0010135C90|nr:WXG100 family type VII secretion target [Cellulomonas endophytica]
MANLSVTYGDLRDAATRLAAGQEQVMGVLAELSAGIEGLVVSGFVTDQASVAFGEAYRQYSRGATDVVQGLTGLGQFLRTTATTYEDLDGQLAAALRG